MYKQYVITYYERLSLVLGVQHKKRVRHIAICGLPRSTVFFHIIEKGTIFEKKILNRKCVLIFSTTLV
jgi:hypothetical protein